MTKAVTGGDHLTGRSHQLARDASIHARRSSGEHAVVLRVRSEFVMYIAAQPSVRCSIKNSWSYFDDLVAGVLALKAVTNTNGRRSGGRPASNQPSHQLNGCSLLSASIDLCMAQEVRAIRT